MKPTLCTVRTTADLYSFPKEVCLADFDAILEIVDNISWDLLGCELQEYFYQMHNALQLSRPAVGMQVFNLETMKIVVWDGQRWMTIP